MSSEWDWVRLGDYCEKIGSGATPKGGKDAYLEHGPFYLIRSQNVYNDGFFPSGLAYISEEQAQKLDGVAVQEGDVLLNITGDSVARVCLALAHFLPARVNQHVAIIRPRKSKFDSRFLRYFLASPYHQDLMLGLAAAGATRNALTKGMIEDFKVPCPALSIQTAISNVLSALDNRITLLRETNATLEAIAQALFKSWFVDFDPVRAKAEGRQPEGMDAATAALFPDRFEESELGLLPKGWMVRPIGELVEGIYDGPHATPSVSEDGPVFLGIKNLTGTSLNLAEVRHISEKDWKQWTRRVEPRHGDIVFSYEATLGFFALIPPDVRCCLGRRLALVRAFAANGDGLFWFHQFVSAPFQQLLDKHTIHGATVNRIALKAFPSYPVIKPPEPITSAFVEVVAPLWSSIHENQAQVQTLTQLRDTLLPRLISGQLRLPEANQLVQNRVTV
ncbi:restriction endonuclease subunit S [Halopseudomonas sp.]|uniref:restriction endonuclease subunit S n=1 Tax=Halopseudomonas sp. TaxID=2901191 RepID=UPI0030016BAB